MITPDVIKRHEDGDHLIDSELLELLNVYETVADGCDKLGPRFYLAQVEAFRHVYNFKKLRCESRTNRMVVRKGSWHYRLFVFTRGREPLNFWGKIESVSVCEYLLVVALSPFGLIRVLVEFSVDHILFPVFEKIDILLNKDYFKCPFGQVNFLVERDTRKNDLQRPRLESSN